MWVILKLDFDIHSRTLARTRARVQDICTRAFRSYGCVCVVDVVGCAAVSRTPGRSQVAEVAAVNLASNL